MESEIIAAPAAPSLVADSLPLQAVEALILGEGDGEATSAEARQAEPFLSNLRAALHLSRSSTVTSTRVGEPGFDAKLEFRLRALFRRCDHAKGVIGLEQFRRALALLDLPYPAPKLERVFEQLADGASLSPAAGSEPATLSEEGFVKLFWWLSTRTEAEGALA